jgi:amino acid transporter
MKRIVLRFGLASGALLIALSSVTLPLCYPGKLNFDHMELVGYSSMVLAFLFVFFGVRAYRDSLGGGTIGFGKAFQVGILITLVTCAIYVIAWEITYFNFLPDFLDRYGEHVLDRMRQAGATEAALQKKSAELAKMAQYYANPLFNIGITFLEVFPVGLIVTLVSAAILRRKPGGGTLAERPS